MSSHRLLEFLDLTHCVLGELCGVSYITMRQLNNAPCCQRSQSGAPYRKHCSRELLMDLGPHTSDFQCLLMYAKRSYLPTLFRSGVKISPPFQAGTGVPSSLPVVVLGDGRGSYCLLRSQYWPGLSAAPILPRCPPPRTVRAIAVVRPQAVDSPAVLREDRSRRLVTCIPSVNRRLPCRSASDSRCSRTGVSAVRQISEAKLT